MPRNNCPSAPAGARRRQPGPHFSMVRSSTPPVRNRIWPAVVDLPASTWPMNTMFRCSLQQAAGSRRPDAGVHGVSALRPRGREGSQQVKVQQATDGCVKTKQALRGFGACNRQARKAHMLPRSPGQRNRLPASKHPVPALISSAAWSGMQACNCQCLHGMHATSCLAARPPAHRGSSASISASVFFTSACRASRCAGVSVSTSSSTLSFLTSLAAASAEGAAATGAAAAGAAAAAGSGAGAGAGSGSGAAGKKRAMPVVCAIVHVCTS